MIVEWHCVKNILTSVHQKMKQDYTHLSKTETHRLAALLQSVATDAFERLVRSALT